MRTDLGRGHTQLRPPAVVNQPAPFVARPIQTELAAIQTQRGTANRIRRQTYSLPPYPVVVDPSIAWYGPGIRLTTPSTGENHRRREPLSILRPPTVVTAVQVDVYAGPQTTLARIRPRLTRARLQAPVVVFPFFARNLEKSLSRIRPPQAYPRLSPPTVVRGPIEIYGPKTALTPSRRPVTKSQLQPPVVVSLAVEIYGPEISLARIAPQPTTTRLTPPTVVAVAATEIYRPKVALTKIKPQPTTARLLAPVVVFPFFARPIEVSLTRITTPFAFSVLRPPAVVAEAREITPEIRTTLAPSRRGRPRSTYVFPYVIRFVKAFGYVAINLVRITPPQTLSVLRPPAVLTPTPTEIYGPRVNLTTPGGERRWKRTHPRLLPPVLVFEAQVDVYPGPKTSLVRVRTRPTASVLRPPAVITAAERIDYAVQVTLAQIRPRKTQYVLRAPTILATNEPTKITLVRIAPPPTIARLQPPVVVGQASEIYGPEIALARITPARTIARLVPPAVVGEVVYHGPSVELAPSFRGVPKSRIFPPQVVDQPPPFLPPLRVKLAPSSRGVPKSQLSPPVVIGAGRVNPGLRRYLVARKVRLERIPREPTYELRPPTIIVVSPVFYGPTTTFAPQRRGKPKSFLRPPAILKTSGRVQINLTYSRRGKPKYFLRPPAVVRLAVEIYGPETTFARIKPRPTIARLAPPTDVSDLFDFGFIRISLAPQPKPQTISRLQPPAVLGIAPHRPALITLARITPPPVTYRLKAPTVIGEPERYFGPVVHTVRITPPKVINFKLAFEVPPFIPPGGDVCGFDISDTFICYVEESGSQVIGGEQTNAIIEDTTGTGSRITGGERSSGNVVGGDQEAN